MTWREVTYYQPRSVTVVHGPMYQAECVVCDWMGEAFDDQLSALNEAEAHECRAMSAQERQRKGLV